jgi:hypothetical protein
VPAAGRTDHRSSPGSEAKPCSCLVRAERLADEHTRLNHLNIADLAVRASFGLSYQRLDPDVARAFRLLAQLVVPDLSEWGPRRPAGHHVERAERLTEDLLDVHLREQATQSRYRMHDLPRAFARERLEDVESHPARAAAIDRLLGRCLAALNETGAPQSARRQRVQPDDAQVPDGEPVIRKLA